jgi:RsiW-degrading membrane proteinase PrsW (M82 family)
MEILSVAAYFLPIFFLMAFIGRAGKKFTIYLFWGFLASVPVLVLTQMITPALPLDPSLSIAENLANNRLRYLLVSPLFEEFFKALPIIIPAFIGIRNQDKDVLLYAMASGIGFSLVENWGFIFMNPETLPFLSVLARSFSTSLMHGCTCGIIGYGIVLIRNFDRAALPVLIFGFYTLAVTTHAMYNLLSVYHNVIGVIIDLIFPVLLFRLLLTCYHVDVPALFKKAN